MKFTDLYTQSAEFFNNLDTSDITVKEVRTPEDREKVLVCYANNEVFNPHPSNITTNEWDRIN